MGSLTDDLDVVSKSWVENTGTGLSQVNADAHYVKKRGDFFSGPISMLGNTIDSLGDPVNDRNATNKSWVTSQIPKGLWSMMARELLTRIR